MVHREPPADRPANLPMRQLVDALYQEGIEVVICEPSTRVEVNRKNGAASLREYVSLRATKEATKEATKDDGLVWWWDNYDRPICAAWDIAEAVRLIGIQLSVVRS